MYFYWGVIKSENRSLLCGLNYPSEKEWAGHNAIYTWDLFQGKKNSNLRKIIDSANMQTTFWLKEKQQKPFHSTSE